jgi:hypothetical protein
LLDFYAHGMTFLEEEYNSASFQSLLNFQDRPRTCCGASFQPVNRRGLDTRLVRKLSLRNSKPTACGTYLLCGYRQRRKTKLFSVMCRGCPASRGDAMIVKAIVVFEEFFEFAMVSQGLYSSLRMRSSLGALGAARAAGSEFISPNGQETGLSCHITI